MNFVKISSFKHNIGIYLLPNKMTSELIILKVPQIKVGLPGISDIWVSGENLGGQLVNSKPW